jgi:hypothetical protein
LMINPLRCRPWFRLSADSPSRRIRCRIIIWTHIIIWSCLSGFSTMAGNSQNEEDCDKSHHRVHFEDSPLADDGAMGSCLSC